LNPVALRQENGAVMSSAASGDGPMRVAVIGSGLAGLTASWMLTRDADGDATAAPPAEVELYESAPSLGMVRAPTAPPAPARRRPKRLCLSSPRRARTRSSCRRGATASSSSSTFRPALWCHRACAPAQPPPLRPPAIALTPHRRIRRRYYTELLQLYKAIGIPFYLSSGDGARPSPLHMHETRILTRDPRTVCLNP
jgi:hypothetical protein